MTSVQGLFREVVPTEVGAAAVYPYDPAVAKTFTIPPKWEDDEILYLYQKVGNDMRLPRAVCPLSPVDRRSWGYQTAFNCSIVPRNADQGRVFKETVGFLRDHKSGVVRAMTGFGKTVLALYAVAQIGRTSLVIVPSEDLLHNWIKEAKTHLGLTDDEIGIIRQNKCDVWGKKIVFGMLASVGLWGCQPDRYPGWVKDYFGLLVIDEVHRIAVESAQPILWMMPTALRLGLSATPSRSDGKEVFFLSHIGPIRVQGEVEQMVPRVLRYKAPWKCPRRTRITPSGRKVTERVPHEAKKSKHISKLIAQHTATNDWLVDLIFRSWNKHRKLVVFSDFLDHLETLRQKLIQKDVPLDQIGKYIGGLTEAQRDQAGRKPIVLATYAMMSEGTNLPWLDMAVLATPKSNVEQPVGRIRREHPGKPRPVVLDVVHADSPVFAKMAEKRDRWYRRIQCDVHDMNRSPS